MRNPPMTRKVAAECLRAHPQVEDMYSTDHRMHHMSKDASSSELSGKSGRKYLVMLNGRLRSRHAAC